MGLAIFILTVSAVVVILYWKLVFDFARNRIRVMWMLHHLPGPLSLPLIGSLWQVKWSVPGIARQLLEWGTYYASDGNEIIATWIGPRPVVVIIQPDAAKAVLENNDVVLTKGPEYDILLPWLGTGLLTSTGDKWRHRRKMLTPSFHFKMLTSFVVVHDRQAKIFTEQIEKYAEVGEEFDIFPYIKRAALDIICETAMGTTVSAQTNHNHPYVMAVQRMNELGFQYQIRPWLWFGPFWHISPISKEYNEKLNTLLSFTRKVIAEKMEEPLVDGDGKKAFLDMLVQLSRDNQLNYEDIREEVDTFMFEGHDTTSAGMSWTIWCLAHHPEYQTKVHEEMDRIFGESDRECTHEDLKNIKYLEWCIKEGLRMRPSVPFITRIPDQDFKINDDLIVPKGVTIMLSPWLMQNSPTVFKDPLKYIPDRFSEENSAGRHPYAYIPFSAGPRNCIGQKFALMEEKVTLSWFFRRYQVSAKRSFDSNFPLPELIIKPSYGFPVVIQKRYAF